MNIPNVINNPELTYVTKMVEWLDTMSSVKLGVFWSLLKVSCVSNQTEALWYNETVCL